MSTSAAGFSIPAPNASIQMSILRGHVSNHHRQTQSFCLKTLSSWSPDEVESLSQSWDLHSPRLGKVTLQTQSYIIVQQTNWDEEKQTGRVFLCCWLFNYSLNGINECDLLLAAVFFCLERIKGCLCVTTTHRLRGSFGLEIQSFLKQEVNIVHICVFPFLFEINAPHPHPYPKAAAGGTFFRFDWKICKYVFLPDVLWGSGLQKVVLFVTFCLQMVSWASFTVSLVFTVGSVSVPEDLDSWFQSVSVRPSVHLCHGFKAAPSFNSIQFYLSPILQHSCLNGLH